MTVREIVIAFTRSRSITQMEMANALGYKSVTSLVRLMNGATAQKSVADFVKRMESTFRLTENERRVLHEISEQLGWDNGIEPGEEMLHFLRDDLPIEPMDDNLYKRYAACSNIRIMLINSIYAPMGFFRDLEELVAKRGGSIEHYLCFNENTARTIRAFTVTRGLCFHYNYDMRIFAANAAEDRCKPRGLLNSDVMFTTYVDAEGVEREDMILLDDHDVYVSTAAPGTYVSRNVLPFHRFRSVKRDIRVNGRLEDYVAYSQNCSDIEFNHAEYKVKTDVCINVIDPDILCAAVKEGPAMANADDEQRKMMEDVLQRLTPIYRERIANSFTKRKAMLQVLKRSSMWNFVKTGVQSDHFAWMRPFTLSERRKIITDILQTIKKMPTFKYYFLKDDSFIADTEICLYEGVGLVVLNDRQDALSDPTAEILVNNSDITRLYRDYYTKTLITEHCEEMPENIRIFEEMVAWLDDEIAKENA